MGNNDNVDGNNDNVDGNNDNVDGKSDNYIWALLEVTSNPSARPSDDEPCIALLEGHLCLGGGGDLSYLISSPSGRIKI